MSKSGKFTRTQRASTSEDGCCTDCSLAPTSPATSPAFEDHPGCALLTSRGLSEVRPSCKAKSGLGQTLRTAMEAHGLWPLEDWATISSHESARAGLSRPALNVPASKAQSSATGTSPRVDVALGAPGLGAFHPRRSSTPPEVGLEWGDAGRAGLSGLGAASVHSAPIAVVAPSVTPSQGLAARPRAASRSTSRAGSAPAGMDPHRWEERGPLGVARRSAPLQASTGLSSEPLRPGAKPPLKPFKAGPYEIPVGLPGLWGPTKSFVTDAAGQPVPKSGPFFEISMIVVPPTSPTVVSGNAGCPNGRILLSGTQRAQVWTRDLDCVACPLTPSIVGTASYADSAPNSSDFPNTLKAASTVGAPCVKQTKAVSTFPYEYRYNDSMIVRTKTGLIVHTFTLLKRFAPPYAQPSIKNPGPNGTLSGLASCGVTLTRSVIGVRLSSDCGNTWEETFVDLSGKDHPAAIGDGVPAGKYDLEVSVPNPFQGAAPLSRVMKIRDLYAANFGIDTTYVYADPTTGFLFITTGLSMPLANTSVLGDRPTQVVLVSTNEGQDWSVIADFPAAQRFTGMTSTVAPDGTVKLFLVAPQAVTSLGTNVINSPVIYWFNVDALSGAVTFEGYAPIPYAIPADGSFQTSAIWADLTLGFLDPGKFAEATGGRNLQSIGISRAPSDLSRSYVRVAYPHCVGTREVLCVVLVGVPTHMVGAPPLDDMSAISLSNLDVIGLAEAPNGIGCVFAQFIESDHIEHKPTPHGARPDSAILKYLAWDPTGAVFGGPGGFIPKARGYFGRRGVTGDLVLGPVQPITPWAAKPCDADGGCNNGGKSTSIYCLANTCRDFVGDYAFGGFYVRPEDRGTPRFVVPWQSADASSPANAQFTSDRLLFQEIMWRVIEDASAQQF